MNARPLRFELARELTPEVSAPDAGGLPERLARRRGTLSPVSAAALLASLAAVALLTDRLAAVVAIVAVLCAVCLRARTRRRWLYLGGALGSGLGVLLVSPFLAVEGTHPLWTGPTLPVLGPLDVTSEEIRTAALNALRLAAVGLAFSAYALLLDHDRLLAAAGFARRWTLAVALATRLVPTLERDAAGLREAVRGRGIELAGVRGYGRLVTPLVAGSLERALNLAEAMEARGFGGSKRSHAPSPPPTRLDRAAVAVAAGLVVVGVLWL